MILSFHDRSKRGFSLIELMVAMAISIVLMLVLTEVISSVSSAAVRNNNLLIGMDSGNAVLDLIAQDLDSSATLQLPYTSEYLQAVSNPFSTELPSMCLVMNSFDPVDSYSSVNSYLTSSSDRNQIRSVLYGIAYQDPLNPTAGTAKQFGLYRSSVNASTTFSNMLGVGDLFTAFTGLAGTGFDSGTNPFSNGYKPNSNDLIAVNIVDLKVAVYCDLVSATSPNLVSSNPCLVNAPVSGMYGKVQMARNGTMVAGSPITGTSSLTPGYNYGKPRFVEVSITVLDDVGAVLMGAGTGIGKLSPAAIELKYGHVLTRRIYIRNQ